MARSRLISGTDPVVRRIAVGADTYGLALDASHHKLFVANWGDQASRGNGQGTVSVLSLDPSTGVPDRETAVIPVGHHPEAVALSPNSAYQRAPSGPDVMPNGSRPWLV